MILYSNPLKQIPPSVGKNPKLKEYQQKPKRRNGCHHQNFNLLFLIIQLCIIMVSNYFFSIRILSIGDEVDIGVCVLLVATGLTFIFTLRNMRQVMTCDTIDPALKHSLAQIHAKGIPVCQLIQELDMKKDQTNPAEKVKQNFLEEYNYDQLP